MLKAPSNIAMLNGCYDQPVASTTSFSGHLELGGIQENEVTKLIKLLEKKNFKETSHA